jgi:hypothetical protein
MKWSPSETQSRKEKHPLLAMPRTVLAERRWFAFACIAVLGGCVNLEAVRDFAKTSAATADYQQVVSDYVESPLRRVRYAAPGAADDLKKTAARRKEQRPRLEAAQGVLVKYMAALGDAAADELPRVDSEIDGFLKALEGAKFVGDADAAIGKETASAAATVAKVLTRVVLDSWRRREVAEVVQETDGNIQVVVAGLQEIIENDFVQSLKSEEADVRFPFEAWLAATKSFKDPAGTPPPMQILLEERLDLIAKKRQNAESYAEVLGKIGKGHAELADKTIKLDDAELKARLKQYASDLQTLYRSIKTLSN